MAFTNKKEIKKNGFTSILESFLLYLFGLATENVKSREVESLTGPEAAMAAAAKHFSSKVHFI